MTEAIEVFGNDDGTIPLGDVITFPIVEVGTVEMLTVYLKNVSKDLVQDITVEQVEVPDPRGPGFPPLYDISPYVTIVDTPDFLMSEEIKPLTFQFSPPFELEVALRAKLKIKGSRIILP